MAENRTHNHMITILLQCRPKQCSNTHIQCR